MNQFLPVTKADLAERGWEEFDFLVITGDAYVDHPPLFPGGRGHWQSWPSRTGARPSAATTNAWWPTIPQKRRTTPIPRAIGPACGPTGR